MPKNNENHPCSTTFGIDPKKPENWGSISAIIGSFNLISAL